MLEGTEKVPFRTGTGGVKLSLERTQASFWQEVKWDVEDVGPALLGAGWRKKAATWLTTGAEDLGSGADLGEDAVVGLAVDLGALGVQGFLIFGGG